MKKFVSIFMVLSILFVFGACGESAPDDLPESLNDTAVKSFTLLGTAGKNKDIDEVTFTLSDFRAIEKYSKWVDKGNVQTVSFIEVSGITASQEVELKDVSLALKSNSKKNLALSTISGNGKVEVEGDVLSQLNFLQAVMDEIISKRSSTVVLKCSPSNNMANPNAKMNVSINVQFSFKK